MKTSLLTEHVTEQNLTLKNKLIEANQDIQDLKLSNSIIANSVTIFNERLDVQEKNVSDYLDELNEGVIEAKAEINIAVIKSTPREDHKNPQLNFKPPIFESEKDSRPMQFMRALRDYMNAVKIKNDEILPLLRTCLQKLQKIGYIL